MEQIDQLNNKMDKIIIEINTLNQKFEDHFLSDEDKMLIDLSVDEKEKEKLVSPSEIF